MSRLWRSLAAGVAGLCAACAPQVPPAVRMDPVSPAIYRESARKFAAIVVSSQANIDPWLTGDFSSKRTEDADGGSAAPVASDGYFLTANHVLSRAGRRHVFVILRRDGSLQSYPARIVWNSSHGDLALVHARVSTPDYYQWTPPRHWLPRGTSVMHAGVATGFRSSPGKLISAIPPETGVGRGVRFKHDIPLEPGDSGGPVVDGRGLLVGINSAVEFLVPLETAFFIESEANRPNVAQLRDVIDKDRAEHANSDQP